MSAIATLAPTLLTLAEAKGKTFSHLPPDKAGGLFSDSVRRAVVCAALAGCETVADVRSLPVEGEQACRLLCAMLKAGGCLRDPAGFLGACEGKGWSYDHKSIPDLKACVAREIKSREKAQAKEAKTVQEAQEVADKAGTPEEGPKGKEKKTAKKSASKRKVSTKEADRAFLGVDKAAGSPA